MSNNFDLNLKTKKENPSVQPRGNTHEYTLMCIATVGCQTNNNGGTSGDFCGS